MNGDNDGPGDNDQAEDDSADNISEDDIPEGDISEDIAVISAEPMSDEEWEATYGNPDSVEPTNGSTENTH